MDTASSHKLHHKLTLKELPVLMLNMGGERQIDAATTDVVIYREEFIKALLSEENPVHKVVSTEKVILWVKKNSIFSFCASLLVQLCLMFHAPVSAKAFYYFDCHWLGENKALLRRDYGLACYEDEYNAFLPVAYTLLLGFALFVPLSLTTFIFIHRHELHSPSTRSKIGWLYPRFNTGSEFWEIHELMRKMVLTGMTTNCCLQMNTQLLRLLQIWDVQMEMARVTKHVYLCASKIQLVILFGSMEHRVDVTIVIDYLYFYPSP